MKITLELPVGSSQFLEAHEKLEPLRAQVPKTGVPVDVLRRESIDMLVRRAQAGDENAERTFLELLRARFIPLVKHKLQNRFTFGNGDELKQAAQEVVQKALIVIQQKYPLEQFDNFLAWTNTILRYCLQSFCAAEGRARARLDRLNGAEVFGERWISPDDAESYSEWLLDIERCLCKLGKNCRKIFYIFLQGGSRADILANFPGVAPNAVDVRINRCRKKLKALLEIGG